MKHLRLFLVAIATVFGLSSFAQLTDGTVYWIQDAATGEFISQGANWGTQATVKDVGGIGLEAVQISEGKYKLQNIMWNKANGASLGLRADGFLDQTSAEWEITAKDNGFTIFAEGRYLCNNGDVATANVKRLGFTENAADATIWNFLTKAEYDAAIQAYKDKRASAIANEFGLEGVTSVSSLETLITDVNQFISKNATSSLNNPTLASSWDGWTHGKTYANREEGANIGQGCAEFWNGCGYATQTITGLANGIYKVQFAGTFRPKDLNVSNNIASEITSSPAYVYANNDKTEFIHWIDVTAKANSRADINNNKNQYMHTIYTYVSDGTLELGVVQDSWFNHYSWCPFGQFTLTLYTNQVSDEDIAALVATIPTSIPQAVTNNLTNLKNTLESSKTIADFNALSNAIESAKVLEKPYNHYNEVKTAVLAVNSEINTSEADTQCDAAIDEASINNAIATVRQALLAVLPEMEVPEEGIELTNALIDNPTVSINTDYWTKEGTPNGGYSFGKTDFGETEFYNNNFDFYQTLTLGKGTYEFGVTGFHRAGNHATYFYAGEDKILIPGVPGSGAEGMGGIEWVNSMAQAKTYFDGGNGKVALKFALEDESNDIKIGIVNNDSETDKWTIFRNFTLKYFDEVDYSPYQEALATAAANAEKLNGKIPAAAYTALNNIKEEEKNKEHATIADYRNSTETINSAVESANTLVAPYAEFNTIYSQVKAVADVEQYEELTEGANATLVGKLADFKTQIEATTTVEAIDVINAGLKQAGYDYAANANPTGDAQFNLTFLLTNPDLTNLAAWASADGWYTDQPDGNSQVMINDAATSEDGTKTKFYEYWSETAKANDVFALYQKTQMPLGTYNISCYAFAQDQYAGQNSVGVYFFANNTQGSAVTTARLTAANIEFVNDAEQEVKIGLKTIAGNTYNWMGIGYVELYKCAPKTAVITEAGTEAENFPESNKAYATVTYEGRTLVQGFNTLALPFNIEASELGNVEKVYAYGGSTQDGEGENAVIHLDFSQEVTSLNANTPYIVKMAAAQSELVFENKTLVVAQPIVNGDYFDFVGTYVALPKGNETIVAGDYISVAGGLKAAAGGNKLNAFRAYLKKKAEVPAGAKVAIQIGDDIVDGIEAAQILNNVDGTIYNLNGQKVTNAQKGIFIQNGKKVVIK